MSFIYADNVYRQGSTDRCYRNGVEISPAEYYSAFKRAYARVTH